MKNIAILAAGPPKPNHVNPGSPRNRHLEKINNMVVIDHVISNSRIPNTKLYVDRKSTRLNSSHGYISYAVFCLKKKKKQ